MAQQKLVDGCLPCMLVNFAIQFASCVVMGLLVWKFVTGHFDAPLWTHALVATGLGYAAVTVFTNCVKTFLKIAYS